MTKGTSGSLDEQHLERQPARTAGRVWPSADIRPPLQLEAAATEPNASQLRRGLRDWLAHDIPNDVANDLILVVYEALANAVEHAYTDRTDNAGQMQLEAHRAEDHILVTVSDQGRWRAPAVKGYRGRGIPLMRELTHHTQVDHSQNGTVVFLRVDVTSPVPA